MAKKRGTGGGGPRKRREHNPEDLPELPDPRTIEGLLRQAMAAETGAAPDSPVERAQQLLMEAYREPDPERQRQKARDALAVWPDCADAYVLLAENTPARKDALPLYEQALAAGERALGSDTFRDHAGHFWLVPETRPYMRALLGLAHTLWTSGRREEAVVRLQDLIRLNPNDNQGARYTLASWLLALDRDSDLRLLLGQYDEDSTPWVYTRALLAFRTEGDTPEARKLLKQARKANKHVPAYLLGDKRLPPEPPPAYSPGQPSEAIEYAGTFLPGWKATEGALAWLREGGRPARKKRTEEPAPAVGPLPLVKERLKQLPQRADVWQAGARQLPVWIKIGDSNVRPWAALVLSGTDDLILGHGILEQAPSSAELWDVLAEAAQKPLAGKPHRPTALRVRQEPAWDELKPHLEDVGVRLEFAAELEELDAVVEGLAQRMGGTQQPGLLDVPGVTPAQVGSFFEAAAFYYQQAPWRRVGYESAIKVECTRYQGGPWYAVVMGQSGLTLGLAVYEDLKVLEKLWSGRMSDEDNARETVATAVTFGEESDLTLSDLEAVRQHGWKVARPDAYPSVYHKERGLSMRPPLSWELELMEALLRALPPFVLHRRADDPTPQQVSVPVASGELPLTLAWVVDV